MNHRAAIIAVIGIAIGCNSGTSVTIKQLAAGSPECPTGGVQITVGGGQPQNVCNGVNGSNGVNTLVVTTPLVNGDATCPTGGARIDSGLDNGAGGGTAGDGKLQDGEILTTDIICNGDTGVRIGSLTPPSGPPGAFTINASGGDTDGGVGQAGDGGPVSIALSNGNTSGGSYGGNVKLFRTGVADASFTFPTAPPPTLGTSPANVAANVTITNQTTLTPAIAAGTLFTYTDGNLYTASATGGVQVTSLTIAAGVTATFAMPTNNSLSVTIPQSCVNKGTIAAGPALLLAAPVSAAGPTGGLTLTCGDYFGETGSSVTTAGAAGTASVAGGNAGGLRISTESFWNKGNILASGGAGAPGGGGGSILIRSTSTAFNTGRIDASGGNSLSTGAVGGTAGSVEFDSSADLSNSGNIDTSGGTGSAGMSGGSISLVAGFTLAAGAPRAALGEAAVVAPTNGLGLGSLRNSGNLTAKGADTIAACSASCSAGSGGTISLDAFGGLLTSTGALTSTGGSVGGNSGGGGNNIGVRVHGPSNGPISVPPGNLSLSGNIDARGGWGTISGGGGGAVTVTLDASAQANGQELILYGYTAISSNGGSSQGNASNGGNITVKNDVGNFGNGSASVPGGSVVNYCDLNARGGVSTGGSGGQGGVVDIETQYQQWFPGPQFEMVFNNGPIDVSGGDADSQSGSGGRVMMIGRDGAKNRGALTGRSGNGTGTNASAGDGGRIGVASPDGSADNGSTIDVSAGSAKGDASSGAGGQIQLIGNAAIDSGSLLAKGGAYVGGGTGGIGGQVQIESISGLSSVTAPKPAGIDVSGGAATTQGGSGDVIVDGRVVTDSYTH